MSAKMKVFERDFLEALAELSAQIRQEQQAILQLSDAMMARVRVLEALAKAAEQVPGLVSDSDLARAVAGECDVDNRQIH